MSRSLPYKHPLSPHDLDKKGHGRLNVDVPFVDRTLSLGFGLEELFPALPAGSVKLFRLMLFWAVAVLCSVGLGSARCLCCE